MTTRAHDLVLAAAFLLAFPAAIHLTDLASSEPGAPGEPSAELTEVSVSGARE